MKIRALLVITTLLSFAIVPANAQTAASGDNGPHYSGGPKSVVTPHIGPKESTRTKSKSGGSHHYSGGPKSEVPHHIGPKKDQ